MHRGPTTAGMPRPSQTSLAEPKYRICEIPQHNNLGVIFFCDWDRLHEPDSSFLGKPIYFTAANTANLPFRKKRVLAKEYHDLTKTYPHGVQLGDLGLKMLLAGFAPGWMLDNSTTALHTLCLVSKQCVVTEIASTMASRTLRERNPQCSATLSKLDNVLPPNCELGVVGYHALDPACTDGELDVVIIADNLQELHKAKAKVEAMEQLGSTPYLATLWPLSRKGKSGLVSMDFFYCAREAQHGLLRGLEKATILETRHVFEGTVADDTSAIEGTPTWALANGVTLIGLDNALRGRLHSGDRVAGLGVLVCIGGSKAIVVQAAGNLAQVF